MLIVTVSHKDGRQLDFPIWPSVEYLYEKAEGPSALLWEPKSPQYLHYRLAFFASIKSGANDPAADFEAWLDTVQEISYKKDENPT